MSGGGVDMSGAMRKMERLKRANISFRANIVRDAGAFFLEMLVNEVLNGAYVNRITGMLVRSQTITPIQAGVLIYANLSVAPYAPDVAARTLAKYGQDYLRITKHFTGPDIKAGAAKEAQRMAKVIDEDKDYRYRNPYA